MLINPTLACGNRLNLAKDIDVFIEKDTPLLHIDIMDGHYVSNFCFDFDTIIAISSYCSIPLDIHLMTEEPERWIDDLAMLKPKYISFHPDALVSPGQLIKKIEAIGSKPGIVLNPFNNADSFSLLLSDVWLVQVMGVEPGFAGQRFLEHTVEHIKYFNKVRKQLDLSFLISVDGGVNASIAKACKAAGADIVVAGALAIFGQESSLSEAYTAFESEIEID